MRKFRALENRVLSQENGFWVKIASINYSGGNNLISFKWRHFKKDMILMLVRWYSAYALIYRDIEERKRILIV